MWWSHIANGRLRDHRSKPRSSSRLAFGPAAPDLLIVRSGQALFVECKAPGRKLSPVQTECHDALRRAGATVETADNIDTALAFLARVGVLR